MKCLGEISLLENVLLMLTKSISPSPTADDDKQDMSEAMGISKTKMEGPAVKHLLTGYRWRMLSQ